MKTVSLIVFATAFALMAACSSGGTDDTCECTAGDRFCNGDTLMMCPESCVGYTLIDCTLGGEGYVCRNGSCVPGGGDEDGDMDAEPDADVTADGDDADTDEAEIAEESDADAAEADPEPETVEQDTADGDDEAAETDGDTEEEMAQETEDESPETGDEEEAVSFDTTLLGGYTVDTRLNITGGMSNFNERLLIFDRFFSNDICNLVFDTLAEEAGQEQYYASLVEGGGQYTALGQQSCQTIYAGLVALSARGFAELPLASVNYLLSRMHMRGTYTFTREPGATFDDQAAQFSYDTFYVLWNRGCAQDEPDCLRFDLQRQDIAISQVSGPVGGRRGETTLAFGDHGLPMLFSMLVRTALTTIVLPELYPTGGSSDFLSVVSKVFGGAACADTTACCGVYADAVAGDGQPTLWNDTEAACEQVVARIVNNMNTTLDGCDAPIDSANGLRPLQIYSDPACNIADTDDDGHIDAWGSEDARCTWRAGYSLSTGQEEAGGGYYGVSQ